MFTEIKDVKPMQFEFIKDFSNIKNLQFQFEEQELK